MTVEEMGTAAPRQYQSSDSVTGPSLQLGEGQPGVPHSQILPAAVQARRPLPPLSPATAFDVVSISAP